MLYKKIGKSDLNFSFVGQGTGQFGTKGWGYGCRYSKNDLLTVIDTCMESGINFFDTSETYGGGLSEKIIGEGLSKYKRDDFYVISKVAPWNLRYDDVIRACEKSLKRLKIKYIDLYMIHYPNPFIRIKETAITLNSLIKSNLIRYIGVSNFDIIYLNKLEKYLDYDIIANEIEYNLFSFRNEQNLIPHCHKKNIDVITFSPLAGGLLTGAYSHKNRPRDKAHAFNFNNNEKYLKSVLPLFDYLKTLALNKKVSITQITLSYIRHKNLYSIPAGLNQFEVRDNANSINVDLNEYEIKMLDKLRIPSPFHLYMFDNYAIRPISWIKESFRHKILLKD